MRCCSRWPQQGGGCSGYAGAQLQQGDCTGCAPHSPATLQLEGLNWLHQGYQAQRNLILADEMGLGKTVQVRTGNRAGMVQPACQMHALLRPAAANAKGKPLQQPPMRKGCSASTSTQMCWLYSFR